MLAKEESLFPDLFQKMRRALLPLMSDESYDYMKTKTAEILARNSGRRKNRSRRGGDGDGDGDGGAEEPKKKRIKKAKSASST